MAFGGWPDEALTFYEGLEADNSKSYWTGHKAVYDAVVHGPMADLAEELAAELGGDPKIFRPHRDIRFSQDKTPYKTHIGAVITDIEKAGIEIHGHETLKSAPRGYPADHPRIDLLRHKGLTTWQRWTPEPWLATQEAKDRVLAFLRASAPLVDWLAGHVG